MKKIELTHQQIENVIINNVKKYPLVQACDVVGYYLNLFNSIGVEMNKDNLINRLWILYSEDKDNKEPQMKDAIVSWIENKLE
ncbi:hypothetical protein VF14_03240 [Nostoc linckia z18]|uniref:Uncharacterized protein n=2 Tax=Nostoc linckia TaxID=92942 RepID=A0A9Q5ZH73_NOSLI|nr:hypothetical protein [Nostoc linckia]PHK42395.1 hypothetical protein VF12_03255 [Nostoc linckia z15]PHK46903.1 hypothetical protein VF13_07880 [Nostoc linckia z16]PHJ69165.1 hypothetical protein VF02_00710 [Nostoc linckia z1]PHJ73316.1 hypothetical protein VF05_01725 [Nostoc linckia z3]PHJ78663.1 hypothetical protein VF03_00710 [Nostoc linckia z2]